MEKLQYRSVIRFLFLEGKSCDEIKKRLDKVYMDSSPSMTTVRFWFDEFKRGRQSVLDEDRPGRPKDVKTQENIKKVGDMVLADRRLKVREIAETMRMSTGTVIEFLHNELSMKKLSARWVPRLLTDENRRIRLNTSQLCLDKFKQDPSLLHRLITVDETWLHHYTPETKVQSKQWIAHGENPPKKAKSVKSAGKVMATIFWDSKGIILIDYLEKGKTITGQYYSELLDRFDGTLKEKRPHLSRKKVVFHHDNAPAHTSHIVVAKLRNLRYEIRIIAPTPVFS